MRTSFNSTNRLVEGSLEKDRSSTYSEDKVGRSFESEVVDRRTSNADEILDRDESSLDDLEDEEDSSKVVSSFFETKDALGIFGSASSFLGIKCEIRALGVE